MVYIYNLLRLTFFTQHNALEIYPSCCICQLFVSLYCLGVFRGVDVPWFHQSPFEGHQCCFPFWAITNKTAVNIHVQVFIQFHLYLNKIFFISLAQIAKSTIVSHIVIMGLDMTEVT